MAKKKKTLLSKINSAIKKVVKKATTKTTSTKKTTADKKSVSSPKNTPSKEVYNAVKKVQSAGRKNNVLSDSLSTKNKETSKQINSLKTKGTSQNNAVKSMANTNNNNTLKKAIKKLATETKKTDAVTGRFRTTKTKQKQSVEKIGEVAEKVTTKSKTADEIVGMGVAGLESMKKSNDAIIKAVKKAAEKKKKDEENKLTKDERYKLQAATLSAANAERGQRYDTVKIDEKTKKKIKWNTQRDLDNASDAKKFLYGYASGVIPFTDVVKNDEKTYGIKLDGEKLKKSGYYKTGDVLGFITSSIATGAGLESATAKTLTKAVTKVAGKKVAEKTGTKVATGIAADVASGLPMNIADASENTNNTKDFLKNLGVNTALDAGVSGLISGVRLLKGVKTKEVQAVADKVKAGKALNASDKKVLGDLKEIADNSLKQVENAKQAKYQKYKDKSTVKVESHHAAEDVKRIDDYLSGVNEETLEFVNKIKNLKDKNVASKFNTSIGTVSKKEIDDIKAATGIDVTGYKHNLNGDTVLHIEKRHGKNGVHDNTMGNAEDIARIEYVIKNYDNVSKVMNNKELDGVSNKWRNADNSNAQLIKYEKQIDGKYYVVEAVPDSKAKKLQVTSAYMSTKKEAPQVLNVPKSPQPTSETPHASASNNIISNSGAKSNSEMLEKSRTINTDEVPRIKQTAAKLYNQADDDVAEIMEPWIRSGLMNKKVLASQEDSVNRARIEMENGQLYNAFMTSKVEDNEHLFMARAQVLMEDLMKKAPESDSAAEMLLKVMDKATDASSHAGRMLNATKLLLRSTPEGRLRIFNKEVDNLNKLFGNRLNGKKLELSQEQIGRILKAETDEEIQAVSENITKEMWENIPATWFEKFNEVRHFSMLFNPKTHIRNMFGNTIFKGGRMIAETMEIAAYKLPPIKNKLSKLGGEVEMVRVVRRDVKTHKAVLDEIFEKNYKNADSKNRYVEASRPDGVSVIKNKGLDKWIQRNYNLLEKEDLLILKPEYQKNFVRWCKANGVPLDKMSEMTHAQMQKANAYALRQAEYATFRDSSALSTKIIGLKQKTATKQGKTVLGTAAYRAGNVALESNLPFVKTPVNILRRSMDFSPVGIMRSSVELATAKTADDFIDGVKHMTTGLTGTGIFAFGMWLANQDLIMVKTGEKSGDAYYDRDIGYQDYSLIIKGKWSVTIDWVSPLQTSLFMGATAWDKMSEDGFSLADMFDCLSAITGPMLDMSFMSSSKDTIEMFMETVYRNGTGDDANWSGAIYQTLFGSIPQGYLNSFIPQIFSQTAQVADKYQRDTRSTKEDPLAKSWESFGRKIANRIPGLRNYILNPKLDRFGNDKVTGNNIVLRFVNSYLNPANVKEINLTKTDKEIIDIYNHLENEDDKKYFYYNFTGNPSYDLVNGKRMTYDQAYKYGKEKRKKQAGLIETMINSKSYKNMTYKMKSDEVDNAHWISQAVADLKTYGAKYAVKKIIDFSSSEKNAYSKFNTLGGTNKEFMEAYIKKESLIARTHDTSYYTKALALASIGDDRLAKAYGVYGDKMDAAKEYLKKGGTITEYSNVMCNIISTIQKKGGTSTSLANKALAAAEYKINARTYNAMGIDSQLANMGVGLKKFGYDFQKLDAMEMAALVGFDADGNNSLKKSEIIAYIESLGLETNAEKACVFRYFSNAKNPYGSIPNYLDMKDVSTSSSGSHRRRSSSSKKSSSSSKSKSTSSKTELSDFEKYTQRLLKDIQNGKFVDNPSYSKLTNKYSDSYRKAIAKLLAKKLKES